jgi:hypothetical protein
MSMYIVAPTVGTAVTDGYGLGLLTLPASLGQSIQNSPAVTWQASVSTPSAINPLEFLIYVAPNADSSGNGNLAIASLVPSSTPQTVVTIGNTGPLQANYGLTVTTNPITAYSGLSVTGTTATASAGLNVSGTTHFGSLITAVAGLTVGGAPVTATAGLNVTGTTIFNSLVTAAAGLTVGGAPVTATAGLNVTGTTTFNSLVTALAGLTVGGAPLTATAGLSVTGPASLTFGLTVTTYPITAYSGLAVAGALATVSAGLSATGLATFNGPVSALSGLAVTGAPATVGANLYVPGGLVALTSLACLGIGTTAPAALLEVVTNNIGTTQSDAYGMSLSNLTLNTTIAQDSPPLRWRGAAYDTTITAAVTVDFRAYVLPSAVGAASGELILASRLTGSGTYGNQLVFSTSGFLGLGRGAAAPRTFLHLGGGIGLGVVTPSTGYVASFTDCIIVPTAAMIVTLPPVSFSLGGVLGQLIHVKNGSSGAVTVAVSGSDLIEGATTVVLPATYNSITLYGDGNKDWLKIAST